MASVSLHSKLGVAVVSPTRRYRRCSASARLMMLGIIFSHATQIRRDGQPCHEICSAFWRSDGFHPHRLLCDRQSAHQQGRCSKYQIPVHKQGAGSVDYEFRKRGPTTRCWFPFFLGTRFASSILTCCGPAKREGTRSLSNRAAQIRAKQRRSPGGKATPLAFEMSSLLVHKTCRISFRFQLVAKANSTHEAADPVAAKGCLWSSATRQGHTRHRQWPSHSIS